MISQDVASAAAASLTAASITGPFTITLLPVTFRAPAVSQTK
jgi:hypothetical protein